MSELTYTKSEKISIRAHFNEKWLQDRIEEDTRILGLGELDVVKRERKQSSGGRIDFLFYNSETDTMYETEIQLGKTDESHIIRTIEYWDIEKRRFPNKEHRAVIIAEEITNIFFNVISLMSHAIPIIAIQINALKLDNNVLLNFTKVLDLFEAPEDEEKLAGETVDRTYWLKKSNPQAITMMDDLLKIIAEAYTETRITYNKHHIAVGTRRINFIWLYPRKSQRCGFELRIGEDDIESVKSKFDDIGIPYSVRSNDTLSFSLQKDELKKHYTELKAIILSSLNTYA